MPIDWNIVDDEPSPAPVESSDALDARRVHAIVSERRAAHQARLRAVLVPIACSAICAMSASRAWSLHATRPAGAIACASIGLVTAWIGVRAMRRRPAAAVTHGSRDEPTPDFATLPAARSPAERLAELDR